MGNGDTLRALHVGVGRQPCALRHADKPHRSCGKLCAALSCREFLADAFIGGYIYMEEKKKEPRYLDLSAHAEVNVQELLKRLMRPPEKEEKDNDGNN